MDNALEACSFGPRQRIIQIHPTLRCNLKCTHCYSDSAPTAETTLDQATVCRVLSDACLMGYSVASFSGGEPLLYRELQRVLEHAKSCGMRTTVTSNGTLFTRERLRPLKEVVDVLAISLDGPPDLHNQVRNSQSAFNHLVQGLDHVRQSRIAFGFIHTLTRQSWEHLIWLTEFAHDQGASLLQIHPLELTGRAKQQMPEQWPEDDTLARAYLLTVALAAKYEGRMSIQFDVFHREYLREHPEMVYASEHGGPPERQSAAQLLSPLVVQADGLVVPVCYGFSEDYSVCNLKRETLAESWPRYVGRGYPAFLALCLKVFEESVMARHHELPFLNWYELIVARSRAYGGIAHLNSGLPSDSPLATRAS